MYESDWFSEDTMTKWEEFNKNTKTWKNCQQFFEEAYMACKRDNEAKVQPQESINNVTTQEWSMYLKAMEVKAKQQRKEQHEHIQQITNQNAMLVTMVQEQQKKIEELMSTSKTLLDKMTGAGSKDNQCNERNDGNGPQDKKKKWCKNCKSTVYHNSDACYTLDKNKHN